MTDNLHSTLNLTTRPTAVRLPKSFFLGSVLGGTILAILLLFSGAQMRRGGESLLLLAMLVFVYVIVVEMILVYKMWAAIRGEIARTTPGKAVGLLFIPLYNVYWLFQVFPGFAEDYNVYIAKHEINAPRLPDGLFRTYAILTLLSLIPILGSLAALIGYVILMVMISQICDAVNALPEQ